MPTYWCRCAAVKVKFELSMAPTSSTWKRQGTLLRRMCWLTDWLVCWLVDWMEQLCEWVASYGVGVEVLERCRCGRRSEAFWYRILFSLHYSIFSGLNVDVGSRTVVGRFVSRWWCCCCWSRFATLTYLWCSRILSCAMWWDGVAEALL